MRLVEGEIKGWEEEEKGGGQSPQHTGTMGGFLTKCDQIVQISCGKRLLLNGNLRQSLKII